MTPEEVKHILRNSAGFNWAINQGTISYKPNLMLTIDYEPFKDEYGFYTGVVMYGIKKICLAKFQLGVLFLDTPGWDKFGADAPVECPDCLVREICE